ncbi:YbaY family lipoprotein [Sandaracinobacteroides saxicola]|uniref:YbaY family lipoprotein n=1 Tax=Sandaracinobacteroides saxicola TaxID=2759707 RepID=A0A7G5II44_9SPHN|nr:YbaY family lipoprotein [Sandaracinobacteroides saxicola]QMW23036.1 YbaY family lipoprotein [Sandaracinobacteroides saxicola]
MRQIFAGVALLVPLAAAAQGHIVVSSDDRWQQFVCPDGRMVSMQLDAVVGTARVIDSGTMKRTLFRAVDPVAAKGLAGTRYVAGQLTLTLLPGEIAWHQRPLAAMRCPAVAAGPGVLTGTATYLQRMALPPGSRLTVTLADVSLADAPMKVVATTEVRPGLNQVPLHWLIRYDPAKVPPRGMTWAVSARLVDAQGKLRFITDTRVHVIEDAAAPKPVELVMVAVGR